MRLDKPRVDPLEDDELDADIRARFEGAPMLNIFRTLAHHPKLLKRWLVFGNHVLSKSTLSPRDREIAILRVGWLCTSGYEWTQHAEIALRCGIGEEELPQVVVGPSGEGWSAAERALLRATDELHADAFISDECWSQLSEHYEVEQILDLIFAVGQYNLVSMALNSLGVQLESGERPHFPVP
jgi:alkylhydroperoxidase family enzyme